MKKLDRLLRQSALLVAVFCLSLVLFNWPLADFSSGGRVTGMFVYLFAAWIVVISFLYLVTWTLKAPNSE